MAAMTVVVVAVGAGAATLTRSPQSDEVATRDDDVAIPDREDLQDPDGQQQTEGPQVTCEREGEPTDCVAWTRRLDSAGSAPALYAWRVEVGPERVLARDAETIVALSRTSGEVAWRKEFDAREGLGGPWVLGDETTAVQTGQEVRALSLADGSERWSVDDARLADQGGSDTEPGAIYTIQVDEGWSFLVAHEWDGTVRWRHALAEVDPATAPPWVEVVEVGGLVFLLLDGANHELHTVALDVEDGTERWRRVDARPLHAAGDVAVVVDVDRVVEEEDDRVTVSESPASVVGLDVAEGTERWRWDPADEAPEFRIVDDRLVTIDDDLLAGIDLATGEDLWQGDAAEGERLVRSAAIPRSSVSRHQRVFSFVPRDRRVLARDPATGEILWQTQLDPHVGHVTTVDGAILARVSEATSVQVDPPTGRVRGTVTTTSDGRPALVAGDVLVDSEAGWAAGVDLFD